MRGLRVVCDWDGRQQGSACQGGDDDELFSPILCDCSFKESSGGGCARLQSTMVCSKRWTCGQQTQYYSVHIREAMAVQQVCVGVCVGKEEKK